MDVAAECARRLRHCRRPPRLAVDDDDAAGDAGGAAGAGLLDLLPERRAEGVARALLPAAVALRVLDDGRGAGAHAAAAVYLLGAGRRLLVPANRFLVPEAGSGARGAQGVLDHEGRRRRAAD